MYNPGAEGHLDLVLSNLSDFGKQTPSGWVAVPTNFTGIRCSPNCQTYYYTFKGYPYISRS